MTCKRVLSGDQAAGAGFNDRESAEAVELNSYSQSGWSNGPFRTARRMGVNSGITTTSILRLSCPAALELATSACCRWGSSACWQPTFQAA
jgi:hypothetical protein